MGDAVSKRVMYQVTTLPTLPISLGSHQRVGQIGLKLESGWLTGWCGICGCHPIHDLSNFTNAEPYR